MRIHNKRPKFSKTLLFFLNANLSEKSCFFITILFWGIGMITQKLGLPLIGALAFDKLIELFSANTTDYWQVLLPYLVVFILAGVVSQICVTNGLLFLSRLETRVRPRLQMQVYDFLTAQSLHFHANNFSGSLVTQTNRLTGGYITVTDQFILSVLRMFVVVVVSITVIVFFSPLIALAMLLWVAIFVFINLTLTRRRIHLSKIAAEADSVLTGHLADTIGNVQAVKSFSAEKDEQSTHARLAEDRAKKKYFAWTVAIRNDIFLGTLMFLLQFMILVLSIYGLMNELITIGILVLVQIYVAQIVGELWGLSGITRTVEQAIADSEEMVLLLEQPIYVQDRADAKELTINRASISFSKMSFTHADAGNEDVLFRDFTLNIKPGEKIGLVGHSGSGKTTLTKLILRFNDIDGGSISISDVDIRNVTQSSLRRHIAYVPQEPILFHRSIKENISYGSLQADDQQIKAAATSAYADAFIQKLPNGYDTIVGERGVKLSGGQRQRIAIARALLKDAPILVLDEATSALDSESEKLIQQALWKLMEGRTAIVIAHRLSTIQKMDRIVVLDNGSIVEQGSHKELLGLNSVYASLWAHQSGGFIEE